MTNVATPEQAAAAPSDPQTVARQSFIKLCEENEVAVPEGGEITEILRNAAVPGDTLVTGDQDIRNRFFNHFNSDSIEYINMLATSNGERFNQAQMLERFAVGAGKLKLLSDRNQINRKMFSDLTPVTAGQAAPAPPAAATTPAAAPQLGIPVSITATPVAEPLKPELSIEESFNLSWEEILKKVEPNRMNSQVERRKRRLTEVESRIIQQEQQLAQYLQHYNSSLAAVCDSKREREMLMLTPTDGDGSAKMRREILKAVDTGAWTNPRAFNMTASKWCMILDTKIPAIWSFQGKQINFGHFMAVLLVDGLTTTLRVLPLKDNIFCGQRERPYYFQYFNHNGEVCWGSFQETFGRLMQTESYGDILNALWQLLSVAPSEPTNPYAAMDLFVASTPVTDQKRASLIRSLGLSEYDVLGIPRPAPGQAPVGGIRPLQVTIVE